MTPHGRAATLGLALATAVSVGASLAHAAGPLDDPAGAVHAAAQIHEVDVAPLLRIVACESRFEPSARGDRGHSHGLVQLSDLPGTGLLWHFRAVGDDDPYDPEQAADYLARVAAGEWAREGVTLRRWSCWWR